MQEWRVDFALKLTLPLFLIIGFFTSTFEVEREQRFYWAGSVVCGVSQSTLKSIWSF